MGGTTHPSGTGLAVCHRHIRTMGNCSVIQTKLLESTIWAACRRPKKHIGAGKIRYSYDRVNFPLFCLVHGTPGFGQGLETQHLMRCASTAKNVQRGSRIFQRLSEKERLPIGEESNRAEQHFTFCQVFNLCWFCSVRFTSLHHAPLAGPATEIFSKFQTFSSHSYKIGPSDRVKSVSHALLSKRDPQGPVK